MIKTVAERYQDAIYALFRIMVGLLFFQHGAQKLFGWFGDNDPVLFFSVMGLVGLAELLGGLGVALGVFTRLASFGGIVLTILIYIKAHAFNGLVPIQNRGELALLYLAAFLVITVYGAGKWSLEKAVLKKEMF
ncbi:DoxX family protein [Candidatus Woesearchaeota archaeon]|nr:DoxX family protein [Candidatus Woesearchaeota archaeon]